MWTQDIWILRLKPFWRLHHFGSKIKMEHAVKEDRITIKEKIIEEGLDLFSTSTKKEVTMES